jgi:hypothetical protein
VDAVEIWIQPAVPDGHAVDSTGKRFQATLDTFVTGFGHRFNFKRMQVKDVRLMAKLPDGKADGIEDAVLRRRTRGAFGENADGQTEIRARSDLSVLPGTTLGRSTSIVGSRPSATRSPRHRGGNKPAL